MTVSSSRGISKSPTMLVTLVRLPMSTRETLFWLESARTMRLQLQSTMGSLSSSLMIKTQTDVLVTYLSLTLFNSEIFPNILTINSEKYGNDRSHLVIYWTRKS